MYVTGGESTWLARFTLWPFVILMIVPAISSLGRGIINGSSIVEPIVFLGAIYWVWKRKKAKHKRMGQDRGVGCELR